MTNENNAIKIHYGIVPNKTEIFNYSSDLKIRLGALPDEITLKDDSRDSVRSELYMYARDLGRDTSVEAAKARQEVLHDILDRVGEKVTAANDKFSAEIDKVCKSFETYIKGKMLEIRAEHDKIADEAKAEIDASFDK